MARYGKDNPNWKGGPVEKRCLNCNKIFYVCFARSKQARACSVECNNKLQTTTGRSRKRNPNSLPKPQLYKPYTRVAPAPKCGHITRKCRSYCHQCTPYQKKGENRCCVICSVSFWVKNKSEKTKTCEKRACKSEIKARWQLGEKSHKWRGGLTGRTQLLRNSRHYKLWRTAVFERDDYTCQLCGERGGALTADHIKPWALYPALRFDVLNGRTLCRKCHKNVDTTGYKTWRKIREEEKEYGRVQYRLL